MQTNPLIDPQDLVRRPSLFGKLSMGCLIALAVPILCVFLLIKIPMWVNDGRLDDFAERFYNLPLPPSTEFADHDAQGSVQLRSNGNHCDYLVRFSLRTRLSDQEITRYYEKLNVAGVDGGRAYVTVYSPKHSSRFEAGRPEPFIVEIFDSTDPGWDIRCH
ncbi:hypothetical protein [Microbispora sp. NPDC049125]|uniref:hypothetical protein n=1 Tax=Microbispora sp. NPDC049125 TaxID=3154929 RepID=UPI00346550AD